MANFHEIQDLNQRSMPKGKQAAPEMRSMQYQKSANGGHVFTHEMHSASGNFHEPETHTFGADQGKEALGHFAQHSGLAEHLPQPDKDSAAGTAT